MPAVPRDWLWLTTDRASTNLTGVTYLVHEKHALVGHFGDMCHDVWNEIKNAASDATYYGIFKPVMLVANCFYAPFDSGLFWTKTLQAAQQYKAIATSQCPLFGACCR